MAEQRDDLESRIETLATELAQVRGRLDALEAKGRAAYGAGGEAARISVTQLPQAASGSPNGKLTSADTVGLVGRTLVVLGGGFLLRAVSAASLLPALSGPATGLAYAAWWLSKADRTASRGERQSAFFYALSGVAIAYPLIWETSARFHLLPGAVAAPALVLFLAMGLLVAWRRLLPSVAWLSIAAALTTTVGLFFWTQEYLHYASALLVSALAVEAIGFRDRWPQLRWPPAFAVDLIVLVLGLLASHQHSSPEVTAALPPQGVIAVCIVAPVIYLVSVAARTLVYRQVIAFFELIQVAVSLLLGIGSAVAIIAFNQGDHTSLAIAIVASGAACYAVAFASIDPESGLRRNFYSYTSFAGILVLVGSSMLLGASALALVWLALGLLALVLGCRFGRMTLRVHGALYLAASALCSGLLEFGLHGLIGQPPAQWPAFASAAMAAGLGSAAGYALLARTRDRNLTEWSEQVPRLILGAVICWSLAGALSPWLADRLFRFSDELTYAAFLASTRTAVLSCLAVALAWGGRRWSLPEQVWLVYPLLAATGGRLLWEDIRYGEPVNLFLALAFYGGALIVTSRLLRQDS
ncbi:MAG: hypothetical protein HY899_04420 [Deltaproteobacteria bacterium]|nr:hypothetical protein [Deltaproteobacteria bacterium]